MAENQSMNWPEAFKDVLIAAIVKGNAIPVLWNLVVLVIFWRLPPERIYDIIIQVINFFSNRSTLGYSLAVISLIGWAIYAGVTRSLYKKELDRMAMIRNESQEKLGLKLQTSNLDL